MHCNGVRQWWRPGETYREEEEEFGMGPRRRNLEDGQISTHWSIGPT